MRGASNATRIHCSHLQVTESVANWLVLHLFIVNKQVVHFVPVLLFYVFFHILRIWKTRCQPSCRKLLQPVQDEILSMDPISGDMGERFHHDVSTKPHQPSVGRSLTCILYNRVFMASKFLSFPNLARPWTHSRRRQYHSTREIWSTLLIYFKDSPILNEPPKSTSCCSTRSQNSHRCCPLRIKLRISTAPSVCMANYLPSPTKVPLYGQIPTRCWTRSLQVWSTVTYNTICCAVQYITCRPTVCL